MAPSPEDQFLSAYDDFAEAIFRHCFFRLMDRDRARDVTQDVFLRTWEYIRKGNTVDNIRAFLYRVANNLIVDTVRKKSAISLDMLQENGFDPSGDNYKDSLTAAEMRETLKKIFSIEPQYREVIMLRFVDGLGPKEIAEVLDEPENTISVRINRAIKKLRNELHIDI